MPTKAKFNLLTEKNINKTLLPTNDQQKYPQHHSTKKEKPYQSPTITTTAHQAVKIHSNTFEKPLLPNKIPPQKPLILIPSNPAP